LVGCGEEHLEGCLAALGVGGTVAVGVGLGVVEDGFGEVVEVLVAPQGGAGGELGPESAGGGLAGGLVDQVAGADAGEPHAGASGVFFELGAVGLGVGLDDLGLGDLDHPAR
jgi:hypothetical protein